MIGSPRPAATGEVLAAPAYRDAADRKKACEAQQQLADLQAELRRHADLGQWQAVLDVDAETSRFDPSFSDPDGLATRARAALVAGARAAGLGRRYAKALAEEDSGDWTAAARGYDRVLEIDPAYRDAAARKEACQTRQRMADLQAELRQHAGAGQWQAVIDVDAELGRLDPSASDPDGLASRARDALAAERAADLERRYDRARAAADGGDWAAAARGYDQVLEIDPAYRDAAARRNLCRPGARLQAELDRQAVAEDWLKVLATLDELSNLDPSVAAKPLYAQLAARARLKVVDHPGGSLWRIDVGDSVEAVSWHPDGRRIAVACKMRGTRWTGWVYDLSGIEPKVQMAIKDTSITAVVFSPDGTRLATGGYGTTAVLWDTASGNKLREFSHESAVPGVAFSLDGTRLATGSWDQSTRVWDTASGEKQLEVRYEPPWRILGTRSRNSGIPKGAVRSVAFSLDGTRLATASRDTTPGCGTPPVATGDPGPGHDSGRRGNSPDCTRLATVGADTMGKRVWDSTTGQQLIEVRHEAMVNGVGFSPYGTRLATSRRAMPPGCATPTGRTGRLQVRHDAGYLRVAFSPDGTRLATASADNSVQIWSVIGL